MKLLEWSEKLMSMDDDAWRRHANPWSVYSRFTILPLISLAFWSREVIGMYALIPIALSIFWVWINPRLFRPPKRTNNWASMGTFGERIYLNGKQVDIPEHHIRPCRNLLILSAIGFPLFIYGLYSLNIAVLVFANVWIMVFKAWFVDRMVCLYLDMKDTDSEYATWLR